VFGGRRPQGLCADGATRASALASFLASQFRLEAGSVDAFRLLRRELASHGAPRKLLRRASRAGRDERRHTRAMRSLSGRWGARPEAPASARVAVRDLEAVAVENAAEGCVRETFGAVVATWQATHARDSGVRAAMSRIAREETQHATLAWEVAQWAERRLPGPSRRRVADARRGALETLARELAADPPRELVEELGVPTAAQAARLLQAMGTSLRLR
jgi:hypothetical protein